MTFIKNIAYIVYLVILALLHILDVFSISILFFIVGSYIAPADLVATISAFTLFASAIIKAELGLKYDKLRLIVVRVPIALYSATISLFTKEMWK